MLEVVWGQPCWQGTLQRKRKAFAVSKGYFLLFFSFLLCVKDVWLPSQHSLQCAFVFQIRKTKQAVSQYSCRAVCCIKLWAMYAMERALADASTGDVWWGYKNSDATWSVCKQLWFSSSSVETPGVSSNLTQKKEIIMLSSLFFCSFFPVLPHHFLGDDREILPWWKCLYEFIYMRAAGSCLCSLQTWGFLRSSSCSSLRLSGSSRRGRQLSHTVIFRSLEGWNTFELIFIAFK